LFKKNKLSDFVKKERYYYEKKDKKGVVVFSYFYEIYNFLWEISRSNKIIVLNINLICTSVPIVRLNIIQYILWISEQSHIYNANCEK
jgi:hypothetical protein